MYFQYQLQTVLLKWLEKEIFTNNKATLKAKIVDYGTFMNSKQHKTTIKYSAYQLHHKKQTEREYEISFICDPNSELNKDRPDSYKQGIFTITAINKIP